MILPEETWIPPCDRHRDDPYGAVDPTLGRQRRPSDDFWDHRKLVLKMITASLAREAEDKRAHRKRR